MKNFKNIFEKEYLENLSPQEKINVFIKNNILLRTDLEIDSLLEEKWKEKGVYYQNCYSINQSIYDTILNDFLIRLKQVIDDDNAILKIKGKLKVSINKLEKEKQIKKIYKKIKNKLHEQGLTYFYLLDKKEFIEYGAKDFIDYCRGEISYETIDYFLTNEYFDSYYYTTYPFNEWLIIAESIRNLDFLKEELAETTKESNPEILIEAKKERLSSNQCLILLDKIRNIEADIWENIGNGKKAILISKITGFSSENIRKNLPNLEKAESHLPQRFIEDIAKVEIILNKMLG